MAKSKTEGYEQIAAIFLETATNKKEHAEQFYSYLTDVYDRTEVFINDKYLVGIGDTAANLKYAAADETEEAYDLYP